MAFSITDNAICGEAYREAISELASELNSAMGTSFFYARDYAALEILAERLGIRFNENGEIIRREV